MMYHAKCVRITARVNIMGFSRVMVAQAFSNVRFDDREIMCVKQKPKAIALWIKHIEINAAHVALRNALKSA